MPTIAVGLAFGNGGYQTFGAEASPDGSSRLPSRGRTMLAPSGCAVGMHCYRQGWSRGLSDTDACRHDRDASARVVRSANDRGGRGRSSGGCHCCHRNHGLAAAAGIDHRSAYNGAIPRSAESSIHLSSSQLHAREVVGPIEVVSTLRRGEAAAVAPTVPIARGWSRQVDTGNSPVFYDGTLNADTYRKWLDDNAISYVAISQGPYDWASSDEATLVRHGLPYLQAVWSDRTWTLYAVTNPRPVISPPGQAIARDGVSLTVSLPEPGEYVMRVRWSRYLSASSGCVRPAENGWSMVVVHQPGTVKIQGSLAARHC